MKLFLLVLNMFAMLYCFGQTNAKDTLSNEKDIIEMFFDYKINSPRHHFSSSVIDTVIFKKKY